MDPITLAAIMGGTGLLKSTLVDLPRQKMQQRMRGEEIRYSPWTGMKPDTQVQYADPLGTMAQMGVMGALAGKALEGGPTNTSSGPNTLGFNFAPEANNIPSFWNRFGGK